MIYPTQCLSCETELTPSEHHLCNFCNSEIERTHFEGYSTPTPMDKLFWGRVDVHATYAHFFFNKNKTSQRILFNLKYKNDPTLGEYFGEEIGKVIQSMDVFQNADAILPVPLHFRKEFTRGYNQSMAISIGIQKTLNTQIINHLAKRTKHTLTQTKKSRFDRWDNVEGIFKIDPSIKTLKHIIVVDDVITTGATMEALIRALRTVHPELKVSVVTLAIA